MNQGQRATLITGLIITLLFFVLFVRHPSLITYLDQKLYDVMLQQCPSPVSSKTVVVDIDDTSLEVLGQWPWPRQLLARLLARIASASPRAVGVDILLSEPDRTAPVHTLEALSAHPRAASPLKALREALQAEELDHDLSLVRALGQGPFILADKFLPRRTTGMPPGILPLHTTILPHGVTPATITAPFPSWRGILSPLPPFLGAAAGSGFVNALADSDGIVRQTPFITAYKGKFYPSLALSTLMYALDTDKVILCTTGGILESVSIKNYTVPVSPQGNLLLNFHKPPQTDRDSDSAPPTTTYEKKLDRHRPSHKQARPLPTLSAAELLTSTTAAALLHDRIVFVGASASGLGDHHHTPLNRFFYGVGIHATAVDNVLNRNTLSRPGWGPGVEWMLVLFTGLVSTLLLMYLSPWSCMLFMATTAVATWELSLLLLQKQQLYLSATYPLLTLFVTVSLLSIIRFRMEEKIRLKRTRDMVTAQNLTLIGITSLAATRDKETGMHIRRTATFVKILARRLQRSPRFKERLDDHTIEVMYKSAPLHDIGKVGVPDAVLLKPGKLTQEEFKEIQKHTDLGWRAIDEAEKASGIDGDTSFLKVSKEICQSHHEKWDGSGYNHGLKGEEIPLSARIMAVADVYDALTSKRVYKASFDHTKAKNIIVEGRGSHFDPDVVDAFLKEQEQFQRIAVEMADT